MSLDPYPSPAEIRRMAQERGALPRIATATPRTGRTTPSVRPWHPYRSKWEAEYARILETERAAGLIRSWEYEPERLQIGVRAFYTPDFKVTTLDNRIEWIEVKGYFRQAAIVRIKAAALRYPDQRFTLATKIRGEWKYTEVR